MCVTSLIRSAPNGYGDLGGKSNEQADEEHNKNSFSCMLADIF